MHASTGAPGHDELDDLPDSYRIALELTAAGATVGQISERLDVDVSAVRGLLALARLKAQRAPTAP